MGGAMAILSALALGAKFIKQNIPVTAEQKEALIEAVEAAPTKPTEGQRRNAYSTWPASRWPPS